MLAVDAVLLPREYEQHNHEHDQRALRGHVKTERKFEDRYRELIEDVHEHVDDVAEEEPDEEVHQHKPSGSMPVSLVAGVVHPLRLPCSRHVDPRTGEPGRCLRYPPAPGAAPSSLVPARSRA